MAVAIEDVVNYVILAAVTIGIVLLLTGSFINLSVDRQTSTQSRNTINLLQQVVTESPLLTEDSGGNRMKLVFDESNYNDFNLLDCCDSVQYGYRFSIAKIGNDEYDVVSSFDTKYNYVSGRGGFHEGDFCYTSLGLGTKFAADVPVDICPGDMNKCVQGVARLETVSSPLSEMSYWITQVCDSDFDVSKRIPLSVDDYDGPDDVTINNDEDTVCLKGTCKKFYCDKEIKSDFDETLYEEKFQRFPSVHTCRFVKVVRSGGEITLVEPKEGVEPVPKPEVPVPGPMFLPADKDAWTEGLSDPKHFVAKDSSKFDVTSDRLISRIGPEAGGKYISLVNKDGLDESVQDQPIYLNIKDISEELDDCGGQKCVDMKKRNLDKINFMAVINSQKPDGSSDPNTVGILTWKLYDASGNCIVTNKEKPELGQDWTKFTIELLEGDDARDMYQNCEGFSPGDFTWQITQVEWNACKKTLLNPFGQCSSLVLLFSPGLVSQVSTLGIDNFYFEGPA